jgi:hypothetical protein
MSAALPRKTKVTIARYSQNRSTLCRQIAKAERDLKAGKGINWRKVRRDV